MKTTRLNIHQIQKINYLIPFLILLFGFIIKNAFSQTSEEAKDLPVISISLSGNIQYEGGTPEVIVTLSTESDTTHEQFYVNLEIGGNATNGADYIEIPDSYYFSPFTSEVSFNVYAYKDGITEGAETIVLSILPSPDYSIGTGDATIIIGDISFFVWSPNWNIFENFQEKVFFGGTVDPPTPIVAHLEFGGNAVNGVDYTDLSGNPLSDSIYYTFDTTYIYDSLLFLIPDDGIVDPTDTLTIKVVYEYYGVSDTTQPAFIFIHDSLYTLTRQVEQKKFAVYPNPAKDFILLQNDGTGKKLIRIFTLSGNLVKTITTQSKRIDVSDLRSGIYLMNISTNDRDLRVRFLKL